MKKKKRVKRRLFGSVTVFFGMTFAAIMALFFSLTEVLRYYALDRSADIAAERTNESTEALYNRVLFSEFGVLGIDASLGSGTADSEYLLKKIKLMADENGNPDNEFVNFLRLYEADVKYKNTVLYTDNNGSAFIKAANKRLLSQLPKEAVELISKDGQGVSSEEAKDDVLTAIIDRGNESYKNRDKEYNIEDAKNVDLVPVSEDLVKKYEGKENPSDIYENNKTGLIDKVLPGGKRVSQRSVKGEDLLTKRGSEKTGIKEGGGISYDANLIENSLFREYILYNYSTYVNEHDRGGLLYEAEYAAFGKDSDRENLESYCAYVLGLREAENLAAIYADPKKMEEVTAFATALAGATGNPLVIEAIKLSLMATWAFTESVLDLRTLLAGKKIPVVKNPEQWTSSLFNLAEMIQNRGMAKEYDGPGSISYTGYLRLKLNLVPQRTAVYRILDMTENDIRKVPGYEKIRMDGMLCEGEIVYEYTAKPLFLAFMPSVKTELNTYKFKNEKIIKYI